MDYSKLLNERQLEAVSTTSQFVRIIAGAGSGKTRVLTYRIAYLISEMGVAPQSILAIAFTNKVAKEMKERVANLLPEVSGWLNISTFHAFCAKFLRIESSAIALPSDFVIYDEEDQERLVKDIAVNKGYTKKDPIIKNSLSYIRNHKCEGKYPEDIKLGDYRTYNEKELLDIFTIYEQRKTSMKALDFDDLLLKTIIILKEYPAIQQKWRNRIKHILVDEFQDTNDVQYKLIKLLTQYDTNVYVVGDPDQTIYTWRGANQKIILDLERYFPDLETIILDRNYRSTKTILDTANKLISFNKERIKKNLYTENNIGDKILTFQGVTQENEADWILKRIESLSVETEYKNIAILYRSSFLTLPLEKKLTEHQIPYRLYGGVRFYQRKEIKDVLAYFRLVINPLDDVAFDRIVNVPKRGIGESSLDRLKYEAFLAKKSLYEYIANIGDYDSELKSKVINSLVLMVDKIDECRNKLEDDYEVYSAHLESLIEDLGYFDYLDREEDGEERIENVHQLFQDMNSFIKKNPDLTFENWLENSVLATAQDDLNDGDYVSLMTVHVAKGLEFDNVFVYGLNDGVFPSRRSIEEGGNKGLEEERRLCYVAFTRAKKRLFVSCNSGYSYVQRDHLAPSLFFKESGLKLNDKKDNPNAKFFTPKNTYYSFNTYDKPSKTYDPKTGFESQMEDKPTTNGITDWSVGDEVQHEKFGYGVILKIIDDTMVVIDFAQYGNKTILSSHPKLKRYIRSGAKA